MVNSTSESLNTAKPYVDCVFPYIRINIVLDELGGLGTTITIRKNAYHLRASEEAYVIYKSSIERDVELFGCSCESKNQYL